MANNGRSALAEEARDAGTVLRGASSIRERTALMLSRTIFFSLLVLIVLVAIPYGTVEPWWEALFECIVFALGALWIVEEILGRGWLREGHRIFVPVLLIILYAFIQTLPLLPEGANTSGLNVWTAISADPYETRLSILKLLALTLTGVLLLRYTSGRRRLLALIHTIIAVGIISAFFGILRQTTLHSTGYFLPFLTAGSGYAQFINRNHFAFLMEMVLGLTLGLIVGGGVRRDQILIYLSLALPVWVALVLSNSRGGLFSMLAEILFLALLFSFTQAGRGKRLEQGSDERSLWQRIGHATVVRPILVAGLITIVFIGAIWIGGEALTSRLETVSSEVSAEGGVGNEGVRRIEVWRATWDMIKDHPLLGVGFNGYWAAIPKYHNASGESTPQQAHSDYLELMASGGVIGLLLALWFIILLVKGVRQSFQSNDSFRRAASMGAAAGLFGVAIHSMVDFGLHVTINALIFTALVVIALADSGIEGRETTYTRIQKAC